MYADLRNSLSAFKPPPRPILQAHDPETPIVLDADQVPSQVEQITNRGMCSHESLGLRHRFELTYLRSLTLFASCGCSTRLLA